MKIAWRNTRLKTIELQVKKVTKVVEDGTTTSDNAKGVTQPYVMGLSTFWIIWDHFFYVFDFVVA